MSFISCVGRRLKKYNTDLPDPMKGGNHGFDTMTNMIKRYYKADKGRHYKADKGRHYKDAAEAK